MGTFVGRLQGGPSPAGGPVVPDPLIWNLWPPFHVWPSGCCIHPIQYLKNLPPSSRFWPLLLFFGPPAPKSWRRACFKRPVLGSKPYLLIIVREYSRSPFVFPCSSTSSTTVMDSLNNLFCLFDFPSYLHSDRGASFMSTDFNGELLPAALLRIIRPETANARELTRPSGKQLSCCCIAVHCQRKGGRTFSMKHCILCEHFSSPLPVRLLMNECFDFSEKRRLAVHCRLGPWRGNNTEPSLKVPSSCLQQKWPTLL